MPPSTFVPAAVCLDGPDCWNVWTNFRDWHHQHRRPIPEPQQLGAGEALPKSACRTLVFEGGLLNELTVNPVFRALGSKRRQTTCPESRLFGKVTAQHHRINGHWRVPGTNQELAALDKSLGPFTKVEIAGSLATSPLVALDTELTRMMVEVLDTSTRPIPLESAGRKRSAGASCISRADVKAQVTGYLLRRDYKEGSYVNVELPIILFAASSTTKSRHSVPSPPWECLLLNALGVIEVDVLLASCPELLGWGREDAV